MSPIADKMTGLVHGEHLQSFDRFAADYDRFASLEGPNRLVVDLLPAHGGRALDVGCGSGRYTALLAERFTEVVGIDISAPLIDIAQRERSKANVLYGVHDLRSFKDPLGFDLIFSSTTLHHVPDLILALKHLRTLLNPRGMMVLVDNVAPHPSVARWRHILGAVRRFPADAARLGLADCYWLLKFQVGGPWLNHLASDRYLNPEEFEGLYGSVFPGASFYHLNYLHAAVWRNQTPASVDLDR